MDERTVSLSVGWKVGEMATNNNLANCWPVIVRRKGSSYFDGTPALPHSLSLSVSLASSNCSVSLSATMFLRLNPAPFVCSLLHVAYSCCISGPKHRPSAFVVRAGPSLGAVVSSVTADHCMGSK